MKGKQATGVIFNIQKFSLHDGPGIRTVVFFKGCPLRCKWCANPESINPNTGHALNVYGEKKTVPEILSVCLQDIDFYKESGGGVTLSGGEPMLQTDFITGLLKELKDAGIHTAIETSGFAADEDFVRVSEYVDLFLFDIKHWDWEKHIEGTGLSNRLILDNLAKVIHNGWDVLPRLPVIPGYNDSLKDASHFAEKLIAVKANKVQLLPFHQFGENKYKLLGEQYTYADVPALHEEELQEFKQVFTKKGIDAFF